jgi:class 3 adenylate cyclase/tetratricopeptide (TPR) repeat protein
MECHACNATNADTNRFCESCGSALASSCAACGARAAPHAKYCGACGAPLSPPATPAETETDADAAAPAGWGELKQATVLFADIVSSTEQIASLDPEAAMERLQPAVLAMCEAVERYGGTVLRTLGDGVMAIFGVPVAMENHAVLACEAALHMQSRFPDDGKGLSIRVGMHSGQVASDPFAQDASKGGGAHGMTIHLASRVVAQALPQGILVTGECHRLVSGRFEFAPGEARQLRGIPRPVELFALLRARDWEAAHSLRQSLLTPFTGRAKEMFALQLALRRARLGRAGIVGVCGPPGMGKSRLCHEFARWCSDEGVPVFEVRAQVYGSTTPLRPVLELLRVFFFGIDASDPHALARAKIRSVLGRLHGGGSEADYSLICDFLGVPAPGEAAMNPAAARRSRLLALLGELMRAPGRMCCVLLIEDLHWLDEASEEFVRALAAAAVGTRTMFLVNYRASADLPLASLPGFEIIELRELGSTEIRSLVSGLISHRRELQEIAEVIAQRSGGNPFFAEELVLALSAGGVLAGGSAGLGLDSVRRTLPATVQAVIGARIDRLAADQKRVLQICAIVGKEIPVPILQRVTGGEQPVEKVLEDLCEAELLMKQPDPGDAAFAFRHPLIQEVAYAAQLKARRSQIHASVASAMELHYTDRHDELAGLIAHHHEAAGQFCEAANFLARAARWVGATDSAQAIKHWHKVRSLLRDRLQGNPERDRLLATASAQISLLGWREGLDAQDVQPFIEEAMVLADRVDKRLTQLLLMVEGRMLQASGKPCDWYVDRVQKAISLVQPELGEGRSAMLHASLSQAYGWAGLLREGLAANDVALAGVHGIDAFDRQFIGFNIERWLLGMRSRLLTRLGRFDEARRCLDALLAQGEAAGDPVVLQIVHLAYVELAKCCREPAVAAEHAAAMSELGRRHCIPYLHAAVSNCRGIAGSIAGDFGLAAQEFHEALALVRSANVAREHETEILANLAECYLELSQPEQALAHALEAIEISRDRSTRLTECRALITAAAAMLALDGRARRPAIEDALAGARELIALTGAVIYQSGLEAVHGRLAQAADGAGARTVSAGAGQAA